MDRYHGLKFMLSVVTLWLAFAVASPAQSSCNTDCTPCDAPGGSGCTITVSQSSTTFENCTSSPCTYLNIDPICVGSKTAITWKTDVATAEFIVDFGTTTPIKDSTGVALFMFTGSNPGTGGKVPTHQTAGCYTYHVTYCTTSGNPPSGCAGTDPQVTVACNPGDTSTQCPPPAAVPKK